MNSYEGQKYIDPILDCIFYINYNPELTAEAWENNANKNWCSQPTCEEEIYQCGVDYLIAPVKCKMEHFFVKMHMPMEKRLHAQYFMSQVEKGRDIQDPVVISSDEEDEEDSGDDYAGAVPATPTVRR